MSKHRSLIYAIKVFVEETDGIGASKHELKKEYGGVSPKIHSFGAKTRYLGIINDFKEKMFEKGITRVKHVRPEHLLEYLEEKAQKNTEKTMRTNMAALKKFFQTSLWQEKKELVETINSTYHDILDIARESGEAKPFSHPEAVINKLKEPPHKAIATIQLLTGARIDDVPKVAESVRNGNQGQRFLIFIEKSKGGRDRCLDFTDRVDKFEKVKEAVDLLSNFIDKKGWKTIKEEYYRDLKNAVSALGETYTGSHAFRVNYAQRRHQELMEIGPSEKEASQVVTQELGHNRISMAKAYVYR